MVRYPFSPSVLDAFPEELAELFRGLELTLLREICSRLKISGNLNEVTVDAIRALRSHGIDLDEINAAIAQTVSIGADKLEAIMDDVVLRNQKYYKSVIDIAKITEPERLVDESDIAAIRRQTMAAYKNITGSMGFLTVEKGRLNLLSPAKAYQWALDQAELQVQSGAISYNQAISSAIKQLADKGVCVAFDKNGNAVKNVVKYERGGIQQLDVCIRRAVMTGVNQLNQKYREQSMDYLETDLVQTTAHLGARNIPGPLGWEAHSEWQGKIYRWEQYRQMYPNASKGDYKDFDQSCGVGKVTGIGGANCRHSFYAFVEGVMEPTYTDDQLEAMKPENRPLIEFDGKKYNDYQATQMQRRIERTIRKKKRELAGFEAAGQTEQATAAKAYLRALNKKYKDFSKAAGLPEQRDRIKVVYQ